MPSRHAAPLLLTDSEAGPRWLTAILMSPEPMVVLGPGAAEEGAPVRARGHCQRPRVGSVVMGTWSTEPLGNESAFDTLSSPVQTKN